MRQEGRGLRHHVRAVHDEGVDAADDDMVGLSLQVRHLDGTGPVPRAGDDADLDTLGDTQRADEATLTLKKLLQGQRYLYS